MSDSGHHDHAGGGAHGHSHDHDHGQGHDHDHTPEVTDKTPALLRGQGF